MWNKKNSGIYIHVPFCHNKCGYCDFYSITKFGDLDNFLDSLQLEMDHYSELWQDHQFDTIYFGGGTPSVLSPESIDFIVSEIRQKFNIDDAAEVTLEANPGTIDREKAAGYKQGGINRVSMGVQSFNDSDLKFLERIHNSKEIYTSFSNLREAGFNNISIDIISALPGHTEKKLFKNLENAVQMNPEHISVYTLIIEQNTPFGKMHTNGQLKPLDEEKETDQFFQTIEFLEAHGFHWYEISNFSQRPDLISRHNAKYWNFNSYLGLGPSAHSFDGKNRWSNPRSIKRYVDSLLINNLPQKETEDYDVETRMLEYAFLGLRQKKGIDKIRFSEIFKVDFDSVFAEFIAKFSDSPWMINGSRSLKLTKAGFPLSDEIATYFKVDQECVIS